MKRCEACGTREEELSLCAYPNHVECLRRHRRGALSTAYRDGDEVMAKSEAAVSLSAVFLGELEQLALADVAALKVAQEDYGDSWKKRGGVGAFMMLARKWDRLEKQVEAKGWDVFAAIKEDQREEGILDDIRDLRRYLLLVETEMSS